MEPLEYIALANGAISMLEILIPKVQEAVSKGEITVEVQAALMARVDSFRNLKGSAFDGPEWKKSTNLAPAPETPPTSIV